MSPRFFGFRYLEYKYSSEVEAVCFTPVSDEIIASAQRQTQIGNVKAKARGRFVGNSQLADTVVLSAFSHRRSMPSSPSDI